MGAIFYLSNQPDLSSGLGAIDLVGRKIVHAVEFGALWLLWWRALRSKLGEEASMALALAFAVVLAYAGLDEYHQTFVEGRSGSPVDVAIDAAGALAAMAAVILIRRRRRTAPARI